MGYVVLGIGYGVSAQDLSGLFGSGFTLVTDLLADLILILDTQYLIPY